MRRILAAAGLALAIATLGAAPAQAALKIVLKGEIDPFVTDGFGYFAPPDVDLGGMPVTISTIVRFERDDPAFPHDPGALLDISGEDVMTSVFALNGRQVSLEDPPAIGSAMTYLVADATPTLRQYSIFISGPGSLDVIFYLPRTIPFDPNLTTHYACTAVCGAGQFSSSNPATGLMFFQLDEVTISLVPEPATWALLILGFGAVGARLRRRERVPVRIRA